MAQPTVAPPTHEERRLPMTYEEFLACVDEDAHAEWVNGEAIIFMPPKRIHQRIVRFLSRLVSEYIDLFDLGELFVAPFEMRILEGKVSREPDLLFVAREHAARLTEERLDGPADLVIEILSDSSLNRDRAEKFYEYQEAGVAEYWLFDPRPSQERADFWRLNARGKYDPIVADAEGRYHSAVLPGFWLRPDWLWQDSLPKPLTILEMIAPRAARGTTPATAANATKAEEGGHR